MLLLCIVEDDDSKRHLHSYTNSPTYNKETGVHVAYKFWSIATLVNEPSIPTAFWERRARIVKCVKLFKTKLACHQELKKVACLMLFLLCESETVIVAAVLCVCMEAQRCRLPNEEHTKAS